MKLGSKKASPLNDLDDVVLPVFAEYADDEEVERAAAQPLDEDEASIFWEDLRREASSRKKVYGSAEANRVERERRERCGRFKGGATHPWAVAAATRLEAAARTRLVGDPVLPLHTCVVILFMAYRGRMPRAPARAARRAPARADRAPAGSRGSRSSAASSSACTPSSSRRARARSRPTRRAPWRRGASGRPGPARAGRRTSSSSARASGGSTRPRCSRGAAA